MDTRVYRRLSDHKKKKAQQELTEMASEPTALTSEHVTEKPGFHVYFSGKRELLKVFVFAESKAMAVHRAKTLEEVQTFIQQNRTVQIHSMTAGRVHGYRENMVVSRLPIENVA